MKVLFIAGSGGSGSTILDNILGHVDGFIGVGELRYLWHRGLTENRQCGCGRRFADCDLWQGILEAGYGGRVPDARRMTKLERRALRVRYVPLMTEGAGRRWLMSRLGEYPSALRRLYRAVREHSGSRVIVDSSKLPAYGYLLEHLPDLDVRVVHLVRDPRATAYSWMHQTRPVGPGARPPARRMGSLKAAALWIIWNGTAMSLWWRSPHRYLRIRYEDFTEHPRETVQRIIRFAGENVASLPFRSDASLDLGVNHNVGGNPSRFLSGTVDIRRHDEWIRGLRFWERAVVTAVSWPLLRRFGYPTVPRLEHAT